MPKTRQNIIDITDAIAKIDKELDFVTEFVHLFATIDIVVQEMRTVSEKLNVLFPLAASTNKCTVCKKIVSQHHRTCWIYNGSKGHCLFVCVEVLQSSQPNGVMSNAVSLPNHTFTGQAVLCTFFRQKLTITLLESAKRENDRRKSFMIKSSRKNVADPMGVKPTTSWSPVGCASNWATEAGLKDIETQLPKSFWLSVNLEAKLWSLHKHLFCQPLMEDKKFIIVIPWPLINYAKQMDLYKMYNLPLPVSAVYQVNSTTQMEMLIYYILESENIVINPECTRYMLLNQHDRDVCRLS